MAKLIVLNFKTSLLVSGFGYREIIPFFDSIFDKVPVTPDNFWVIKLTLLPNSSELNPGWIILWFISIWVERSM